MQPMGRSPKSPSTDSMSPKKFCQDNTKSSEADRLLFEAILDDSLEEYKFSDNLPQASHQPQSFDFNVWQRCIVESIKNHQYDIILLLRTDCPQYKDENPMQRSFVNCHLQNPWNATQVKIGDVVSIKAVWDAELNAYKVNAGVGFCVIHPDMLISGTTVVGSLFCKRKAVLAERFRETSPNSMMIVGTIVHEITQLVLIQKLNTLKEIEAIAKEVLSSRDLVLSLCSSQLTIGDIYMEVQNYLPNIFDFVQYYVTDGRPKVTRNDSGQFQGQITNIHDIEENVWLPQLGLKGKIDVSVRVQRKKQSGSIAPIVEDLPLELKTGRTTFSMEHKGQLILYQMMLTEVGNQISSGLLLYLRDGFLKEISGSRNEQRDLIMLRNDLSHYLNISFYDLTTSQPNDIVMPFELPEPITHHSACQTCPYARICSTFAHFEEQLGSKQTNVTGALHGRNNIRKKQQWMDQFIAHLNPGDMEYFIRWCGILALEDFENRKSNSQRSLWTQTVEQRQQNGSALANLKLKDVVPLDVTKFLHNFVHSDITTTTAGFNESEFTAGEYVIVSTRQRLAVATGFINAITESIITITLERNLSDRYKGLKFIIDKNASQTGSCFNFSNVAMLLNETSRSKELRDIIIARHIPTSYRHVLPKVIATQGAALLQPLNSGQRTAVLKALTAENFMLIKGLPGTGKTQTLVAIIRLFYMMGKSVIITSHTHSAVDNVLIRLKEFNVPILRLGSDSRINPQLLAYGERAITKCCETKEDFLRVYKEYNVVGVTCLGSDHCIFMHRKFDICIVDEATQVMQPTILRPLHYSEKFILVGDPEQLPPLVRSREARNRGADESLFKRLDISMNRITLQKQYRMNQTIMQLANNFTYAGELYCAKPSIAEATIKVDKSTFKNNAKWLERALSTQLSQAVIMLNTLNVAKRTTEFANSLKTKEDIAQNSLSTRLMRYANYCEAAIVLQLLTALQDAGYNMNNIGVIAPYRAQVELLRRVVSGIKTNSSEMSNEQQQAGNADEIDSATLVEVNTVDQFQGRDKDIVIYSCTKTTLHDDESLFRSRSQEQEILQDKRRLNVAITRAKYKLILIGHSECLQSYNPFAKLFEHIPKESKLKLVDGKDDFYWKQLLEQLKMVLKLQNAD